MPKASVMDFVSYIYQAGNNDTNFVANVICAHHRNPWKKLRGLVKLVNDGHSVRTGQYALDVLIIDGEKKDWYYLETL